MVSYETVNKTDWFIKRLSSGWFSRKELVELAATEFPNVPGKVLDGTVGQYWSDCVNPKWSTWKAINRRRLRVVEANGRRHIEKNVVAASLSTVGVPVPGLTGPQIPQQKHAVQKSYPASAFEARSPAASSIRSSLTRTMWNSNDRDLWEGALARYWTFVKPANMALEREMDQLDTESIRATSPRQWYIFLLEKYFRWKYTAPNRYASTTKLLRSYETSNRLFDLNYLKEQLLAFDKEEILLGLKLASSIRGLGTAGASGLLAILFPSYFGTVDQFAVKALAEIPELPEHELVKSMHPEALKLAEGVVLIKIMRCKARELNSALASDFWTPRKVDMVLWTCAR